MIHPPPDLQAVPPPPGPVIHRAKLRRPIARRPAGLLAASALAVLFLAGPAPAKAEPTTPWKTSCTGSGEARRCSLSARLPYSNGRGGVDTLTLTVMQDAQCQTLHINFDKPIDASRPVQLRVDGGPATVFYTAEELGHLAQALDSGTTLPDGPPEFSAFLAEARSDMADGRASVEMVARFAELKEPHRLGVACSATARLMPTLRTGQVLRLEFQTDKPAITQVYHWPRLNARVADIPLGGMAAALDGMTPLDGLAAAP